MSNRTYDHLKKSATLILPAAGTLYFALAQIWNLPNGEQVVGTIAAVNVFVGVILGVSDKQYKNDNSRYGGVIEVGEEASPVDGLPKKMFKLHLNDDPEDLDKHSEITFMINRK